MLELSKYRWEKILVVFEGEEIHLDPALQAQLSNSSINHNPTLAEPFHSPPLEKSSHIPPLEKGGEGGFSDKNNSTIFPEHNFEDLRRELVSRKYSYKTVKGYLYYNRDFLKFTGKNPSEIIDEDIKDYLFHLAEEKKAATSTLNQAINALKFYYLKVQKEEKIVTLFFLRQPLMS